MLPFTHRLTAQPSDNVEQKPKTTHNKKGSSKSSNSELFFFWIKIAIKTNREYKKNLGLWEINEKSSLKTINRTEKRIGIAISKFLILLWIKKKGKHVIKVIIINLKSNKPKFWNHLVQNLGKTKSS